MRADYPGAIVVEAANYGYGVPNRPKTWCFHTPEEPADSHPSTPGYLATTDRDASYTYFVSYLGFVFQLVPEVEGAYGNALEGKPTPHWSDGSNLNLQTLSLSFEGYTSTIHQTMPRGSPQWNAGVGLVAHRTKALGLNLDWAFQHKQVSIYRGDCGQWDQAAFIADVKAKMQEDDDMAWSTEDRELLSQHIKFLEQRQNEHAADRDRQHAEFLEKLRSHVKHLEERQETLGQQHAELLAKLDTISTGGVDADALAEAVADKLAERMKD